MSQADEKKEEPKVDPAATHEKAKWKHSRPLTACRFDPTGKYVFTGAEDNTIQRWDLADGKMTPFAAHESWVRAIGFSHDGQQMISGGYDGRLIWWETAAEKPEPIRKIESAHNGWLRAIAVSPSGQQIATCGNDKLIKLWDIADGKLQGELAGHESHVYNVAFHPTQPLLVSCDLKGVVKQWDLTEKKFVKDFAGATALYKYDTTFRADIGGARSIAFSTDGKLLALGGITNVSNAFAGIGNAAIVAFDWETGQVTKTHVPKEAVNGTAWGVQHHPDGYWIGLAGGGGGGFLYFWKHDAVNEFFKLKLPDNGRDLHMHADLRQLAVAHSDLHIRLFAMYKKA
ncbi:WD40 repeat domain-containing protein [Anatilimnocola floriformis]|uniref:WD40 repeat domain-containing protein n=1 Tax=Anatilimnocola floriformis TaxID=2948575 RepID=UPI0020C4B1FA|nr:WD40 repeat domain-containing protein [Anatilimnocola floriformis]